MNNWNDSDIAFLKSNYLELSDSELATRLGRTEGSIERKRARLGLSKNSKAVELSEDVVNTILNTKATYKEIAETYNLTYEQVRGVYRKHGKQSLVSSRDHWTDDDVSYLKANYRTKGDHAIGKVLRRSAGAVTKKRIKLGLVRSSNHIIDNPNEKNWSEEDINFLLANIDTMTYDELAESIGRSVKAVMVKATRMGIITNGSRWSEQEVDIIRKYGGSKPPSHLAFMLNRTTKAVRHKMNQLGIRLAERGGSDIEQEVEDILKMLKVDYKKQVVLGTAFKFRADFVVGDVVIEVNGDYWHGNPEIYAEPTPMQQTALEKDELKKEYFRTLGYYVYEIWESELREDKQEVTNKIALLLSNR